MVFPPIEPPATPWHLDDAQPDPGDDLVAAGADLEPGTLLAGYRLGLFPMGLGHHGIGAIGWWSPDPRGVLPAGALKVRRSLRKAIDRFDVRFEEQVGGAQFGAPRGFTAYTTTTEGPGDPTRE